MFNTISISTRSREKLRQLLEVHHHQGSLTLQSTNLFGGFKHEVHCAAQHQSMYDFQQIDLQAL
jgi:hypothetical protein